MSDTYTNTVISAAIDVLPPVIPLPRIDRPYAGTNCSPSEVKSPADLPKRLFLGSLDEQSFQSFTNGWSAAYLDDDGETRVDINYDHKAGRLAMSQTWRGEFGAGCTVGTDDFGHLARNSFGFPYTWDQRAKDALEARYNIQYLPTQEKAFVMTGFPDGAFKSLACPVPVSKLRDLLACHRAMDADPAIKTTIHGYIKLGTGTVNYLEGRNGAFASDPIPLYFHTFDQTGLPPVTAPVWETGKDGTRALTVQRHVYIYNVTFPFREIDRVISHLHGYEIIGSARNKESFDTPPDAPEFAAVSLQSGLEVLPIHFNYFDQERKRRTFYEQFSDLEVMLSMADKSEEKEIAEGIRAAESVSLQVADEFDRVLRGAKSQTLRQSPVAIGE